MESWHLSINLSAQIAPDYISEYLNFPNFPGGHVPGPPPSMWRLGLSSLLSTKAYKQKMPRNAPGSCCTKFETVQTFSYVQTDTTTLSNVGPTMLGVVASVFT